ncbi:hypothetical protein C0Q70_16884 [Pomacea canaliculata]|uniref:Uncharacterized protein n=1 Tax=Pomacea canaliculata TaxID=400727 RepID=A0A2T7NR13_POMCA|nr:hypothetical protein C0Q70_16884 [Pomacea canaliculata]
MCFCTAHPHEAEVAVNLDHETHLYQHLLEDRHYVRHLRPAAAHNDSVVVDVQLAVTAVAGLVTSTGILDVTQRLTLKWQDPRLKWNATDYGGVAGLSLPISQIWTPDVGLLGGNQVSYQLLTGKHATVENDGKVTWTCDVMMNVRCRMDLSDFPYDTQTCTLAFGSSISLDESVHFHISKSLPDSLIGSAQDHNMEHSRLASVYAARQVSLLDPAHDVEIVISLVRRSQLYQYLVVGPVVLLAMLVPCVFLLPADSSAKITLGAVVQVSICLCLRTICDMVHGSHGSVPRIAVFSVASLALTSISITMAAIVMSLASRGAVRKHVPSWLSTIFLGRCGLRRWLCMDMYPPVEQQPPFLNLKHGSETVDADADASSLKGGDSLEAREVTRSTRLIPGRFPADRCLPQGGEWREIARVIDRLLFLVFVILFMLTSISLLS